MIDPGQCVDMRMSALELINERLVHPRP
jgi:hypothetical protein